MNFGMFGSPGKPAYTDYFFGGGDTSIKIPIYGRIGDRFDFDFDFQDQGGSAQVGFQFNGDVLASNYVYQTLAASGATVSGAAASGICLFASIDTLAMGSGSLIVGQTRIMYESRQLRVIPTSTLLWIGYTGYWSRANSLAAQPSMGPLTMLTVTASAAMKKGARFRLYKVNALANRV